MNNIEIFEKHAAEYDEWFEENEAVYKSEILALSIHLPRHKLRVQPSVIMPGH